MSEEKIYIGVSDSAYAIAHTQAQTLTDKKTTVPTEGGLELIFCLMASIGLLYLTFVCENLAKSDKYSAEKSPIFPSEM